MRCQALGEINTIFVQVAWYSREQDLMSLHLEPVGRCMGSHLVFLVVGVSHKGYAESSLVLDIPTSETVLDPGTGLPSAEAGVAG